MTPGGIATDLKHCLPVQQRTEWTFTCGNVAAINIVDLL